MQSFALLDVVQKATFNLFPTRWGGSAKGLCYKTLEDATLAPVDLSFTDWRPVHGRDG